MGGGIKDAWGMKDEKSLGGVGAMEGRKVARREGSWQKENYKHTWFENVIIASSTLHADEKNRKEARKLTGWWCTPLNPAEAGGSL